MTVKELIELLQAMPQDALVIRTLFSDYDTVEPKQIRLMEPKDGEGIISHNGHLMWLRKGWWPSEKHSGIARQIAPGEEIGTPQLLTCVHFDGN